MKHTRSIQFAAAAAMLVAATAWAQSTPAISGGDSNSHLLAAVGDGSDAGTPSASGSLISSPVEIAHSQQTVVDFRDAGSSGTSTRSGADQIMMLANRTIDVILTLGGAYDSNPRWEQDTADDGEFVTWADLRFILNPDLSGTRNRGFYYGFDVGSSIFSYDSSERSPTGGRDQGEMDASGFVGVRGAKTNLRFDTHYWMNNGSMIDFAEQDRETGRADQDRVDLKLSAVRRFDHSQLNGYMEWSETEFNSDSGLNDTSAVAGDVGWLFSPAFAPKTELGGGFHIGSFTTDGNFVQDFYEPSLRFNHRLTSKTTLWGRMGYTFIDYDAVDSIGDSGFASYAAGMTWAPTTRTVVTLDGARQFRPALASLNQNYYWNRYQIAVTQMLPMSWSLRSYLSYDSADYFATLVNGTANREDEYWRLGADLSHPVSLFERLNGQISAFWYYNTNESTISSADFEQVFTGMKLGLSY